MNYSWKWIGEVKEVGSNWLCNILVEWWRFLCAPVYHKSLDVLRKFERISQTLNGSEVKSDILHIRREVLGLIPGKCFSKQDQMQSSSTTHADKIIENVRNRWHILRKTENTVRIQVLRLLTTGELNVRKLIVKANSSPTLTELAFK